MANVTLRNVVKKYGVLEVVHSINLEIADSEFVVLVGPSGCGKSTTLRMVAGLEAISGGEVQIGGRVVNDLPPRERNISMVFQNYALYPHMTVRENLGFSLKVAKQAQPVIDDAVDKAAEILSLTPLLDRKPGALSGGQRQRVAMGRAIVRHPEVFLFDEPLSNLDAKLRTQMRVEIKKLHQKLKSTIIYVTHDQVEAMTLADRIVIMRDGHIEQVGTPLEVFENPLNTFVATFIGSPPMNLLDAVVKDGKLAFSDGTLIAIPPGYSLAEGQPVTFGVRADNIMPVGHALPHGEHMAEVEMEVNLTEPLGTETLLFSVLAGKEVQAKMFNPRPVQTGERMTFQIMLDKCHLFDAETGAALKR
ncbi:MULTISPECIES: ABC transporter ATP-binding protein [Thalassospira]|uniref:sn-glycerol-3-phosphate ABC transporter ATP-binding protein UgpC n=2 Tax=Thalassospira TaxID=168934 RepID=A0A358HWX2_9PROT|nr:MULTISPECIES: sn-glycerol-3-phosphate ABC transporter ATP-binding protein UgpC [Thalassospira]PKR60206.1 sugar ABC transporter ATP-binding protein [Thalassospira lohafexi]HBU99661.1 sn-glycerol-3-phosphate ABC transporter ATP-binding protein UgpC [Thalassospira lucentensis]HCW67282.1 sn-glycerol-3-phosphate ABC transporter ATP-binding protein UgpC [Thalassospira lucentensis]